MLMNSEDVQKQIDNRKTKIDEELVSVRAEVLDCCIIAMLSHPLMQLSLYQYCKRQVLLQTYDNYFMVLNLHTALFFSLTIITE